MHATRRFFTKTVITALLATAFVGCASSDGPNKSQIRKAARQQNMPIIPLSEHNIKVLGEAGKLNGLQIFAKDRSYVPGVIKAGDTIAVTAFGSDATGLFSNDSVSRVNLGEFQVTPNGMVDLPYIGRIRVGGQTTSAAQATINRRLSDNAVDPYSTVNIVRKEADNYSVQGSVKAGQAFQLTSQKEKVLDAIANAGGADGKPDETTVTVIRNGRSGTQLLSVLASDPKENIALLPGDVVMLGGGSASFSADGALVTTGEFDFLEGDMSLAKAISTAGGLAAQRANPKAIYVFRTLADGEEIKVQVLPTNQLTTVRNYAIFYTNFADPFERMRAGKFQLRDGDVVYVGDSPLAQISKFFQIFNSPPETPAPPQL